MNKKNYYDILGLPPCIDAVAIRATTSILRNRYQTGSAQEQLKFKPLLQEIEHASAVLSCPTARQQFDLAQQEKWDLRGHLAIRTTGDSALDEIWHYSLSYYPELADDDARLASYSPSLSFAFRLLVTEKKAFDWGGRIAEELEQQFFQHYFGHEALLIRAAQRLLQAREYQAACELNRAVVVFGQAIKVEQVLADLRQRHQLSDQLLQSAATPEPEMPIVQYDLEPGSQVGRMAVGAAAAVLLLGVVNVNWYG
ncbi:hypothetical protein [uncultured Ferrimonas sp.]|uniref:hypothetical protein n=1 Tax=uncultured Ferrimonas sp. TaxID=432640 RepID=UPI0026093101|nr:hypothetical protein [uncultured Ferrimonas sp.]